MRKPHILVADDHQIFRKSLIRLIKTFKGDHTFSEASNGQEALDALSSTQVDVLLLDIRMPVMDGVEVVRKIREQGIQTRVIVLTQFDENVLVAHMMALGASTFLNKNCGPDELENALISVLNLGFYQSDVVVQGMRLALDPDHINLNLSPRERQMITLFKEGKSNKEIANIQGLAVHTVETYRKALLKKTKCKNVTELVSLAYRTGLS